MAWREAAWIWRGVFVMAAVCAAGHDDDDVYGLVLVIVFGVGLMVAAVSFAGCVTFSKAFPLPCHEAAPCRLTGSREPSESLLEFLLGQLASSRLF